MTPLPNDVARCMGLRQRGAFTEVCPMSDSCERRLQYETDQERVVKGTWLCQSPDFEMRIRPEVG